MRFRVGVSVVALAVAAQAMPAAAQGTLSNLGFGYPVGGKSTRATATGGAFGEFDPLSPVNPSSLGGLFRTVIGVQTEPEFRTVRAGSTTEKSTAQRVPLLMLAVPIRRGVAVGVSATTFLDRSYTTITRSDVILNGSTVQSTDQNDVRGSIADLRAAAGWQINSRFKVGLGGHLFTGDNLLVRSRNFDDTTVFGSVLDSSRVIYFGTALSVGGEWLVGRGLAAMMSYRKGNGMDSRVRDSIKTRGNVPNKLGLAVRYDGIPGSVFSVGMDYQDWSRMASLGSARVESRDATDWHAGAEVGGPRMRGLPILVRAGVARNALPFGVDQKLVNETRFTGGLGFPVAREFASLDLSVQRANRTLAGGSAKESAWLFGVGIQIRP